MFGQGKSGNTALFGLLQWCKPDLLFEGADLGPLFQQMTKSKQKAHILTTYPARLKLSR
jgi:hypothetical protein